MERFHLSFTRKQLEILKKALENESTRLFILNEDNDQLRDIYKIIKEPT